MNKQAPSLKDFFKSLNEKRFLQRIKSEQNAEIPYLNKLVSKYKST